MEKIEKNFERGTEDVASIIKKDNMMRSNLAHFPILVEDENRDAIKLVKLIRYLSGDYNLVSEYEAELDNKENIFDRLADKIVGRGFKSFLPDPRSFYTGFDSLDLQEEARKLGLEKPHSKNLDDLVDIFNDYCSFYEESYKGLIKGTDMLIKGKIPAKIMKEINKEYDNYQKQDVKTIRALQKQLNLKNSQKKDESELNF